MKGVVSDYTGVEIERSNKSTDRGWRNKVTLNFRLSTGSRSGSTFVSFRGFGGVFARLVHHMKSEKELGVVQAIIDHRKKQVSFHVFSPVGKVNDEQLLRDVAPILHQALLDELPMGTGGYPVMHKNYADNSHAQHLRAVGILPRKVYPFGAYINLVGDAMLRVLRKEQNIRD